MMRKNWAVTLAALAGSLLVPLSAPCQAPKPAGPPRQPSADLAARKQLAAYMTDFRDHPDDAALRDKIVQLAKSMKTPPLVPQAARTDFGKAAEQAKSAAKAEDFKAAAKLFEQVALQAPWYADAYYGAASAYAKAADYDGAKRNLALYMAAVRPGADTQEAENLQRDVEQQQRLRQFQQALDDLKKNPNDGARREALIRQGASFTPPLPLPEDAQRYLSRGKAAMTDAKKAEDFTDAVQQFRKATEAAPWYGPSYYNLAVAQSAASDFGGAQRNLKLYLAWTQDPDDTQAAKDLMYQIEYKQEKAERERQEREAEARRQAQDQQAEAQRQAELKYRVNEGLSGNWDGQQGCRGASVNVSGASFSASVYCQLGDNMRGSGTVSLEGSKQGLQLSGSATFSGGTMISTGCSLPSASSSYDGVVSDDGKTITLRINFPAYFSQSVGMGIFKRCVNGSGRVDHWSPLTVILAR